MADNVMKWILPLVGVLGAGANLVENRLIFAIMANKFYAEGGQRPPSY
jgi:hypothetical protein